MRLSDIALNLREKIEPKLIYSPFLRLIIFNVWFLIGFAAVVLTVVAAALYLPKIWRVTPEGFEPIVKVSGLDMTQNWSLKRNARRLETEGKLEPAAEAWQRAVAENPADISALRGAMENVIKLDRPRPRIVQSTITQMNWLLRLNGTNAVDVDLVARTCDDLGYYDLAAYLFSSLDAQALPEPAQAVLIKNLFHQNRIEEFAQRIEDTGLKLKDPELPFYRLAYVAGWTDSSASADAFAELEAAVEKPEFSERVGHLLLRAAAQKKNLELFSRELDRLARKNEARAGDHALFWSLLAASGRTNDAVRMAESSALKPASPFEAMQVARSYLALGLTDFARDLLGDTVNQYARTPELWIAYAEVLQKEEDWDALRAAARTLRQDFGTRETLWGLSYLFEGRADLEQERGAAAQVAFDQAAESAYDYPYVGAVVAHELARLKYPREALKVFRTVESHFKDNLWFWSGVYTAALGAQDSEELLRATETGYRLRPNDVAHMNNYAAALLVTQKRPEEAIQLTLQLYTKFPQNNATVINHACALLLNSRFEEARALMERVNPDSLLAAERSQYYLTLFETYHSLQMWDEARKARELITDSALFPVQRERLREKDGQIAKAMAASN